MVMKRLTDCAQGYCEMYCKKYMLCFEDPEDCIFKDEIKLYDAVKSIEGIVPFERLLELADADRAGKLVVLPCKVGDVVYGFHQERTILPMVAKWIETDADGWTVAAQYVPMAPKFYLFSDFGKTVFLTREEAEAALALKGGEG